MYVNHHDRKSLIITEQKAFLAKCEIDYHLAMQGSSAILLPFTTLPHISSFPSFLIGTMMMMKMA